MENICGNNAPQISQMKNSPNLFLAKKESTRQDLLERVNKAKQFINNNLHTSLDLKSIAESACLSEFHFIRTFSNTYGLTPYQFLLKQRVYKAEKMLIRNVYSIHEISQACGFETVQTFRKCFKRIKGQSPSQYIKELTI